jgi:hypothetical protein
MTWTTEQHRSAVAAAEEEAAEVLPVRQRGEPPYRCLYCSEYRCHVPLALCGDCRAWYERRCEECHGKGK